MTAENICSFTTFEKLVSRFSTDSGIVLPALTFGQNRFFKDFSAWANNSKPQERRSFSSILPSPSHGLSFPNPADVLAAADLQRKDFAERHAIELLEMFGLNQTHLTQPVSTLSGGETLLLCYAKAFAQMDSVQSFLACSPTYWLNKKRLQYWHTLTEKYIASGHDVAIYLLDGENVEQNSIAEKRVEFDNCTYLDFKLVLNGAEIFFPEIQFPIFHPARTITYRTAGQDVLNLKSPVIITGDNGVGKSVFARMLAGVFKPVLGSVKVDNGKAGSSARLVFQESISQLFALTPKDHISSIFKFSHSVEEEAQQIFCEMLTEVTDSEFSNENRSFSLVAAKVALIAERLVDNAAMIILDEPGWGLARHEVVALVQSTIKRAHARGIAVAVITHQPDWLGNIIGSTITLESNGNEEVIVALNVGLKND